MAGRYFVDEGRVGESQQRVISMRKETSVNRGLASMLLVASILFATLNISACSFFNHGRSVYDQAGIRIGIEPDPSVRRSGQAVINKHPIDISPKEIESRLQVLWVSGYSGTLMGMLAKPEPVPLFTSQELATISGHLATAFREAKETERVFFSLPKPDVTYSEDRTVGFLFFRGRYLHVVLTDHSSFIRTDTSGGDYKDIRDTKGMKLWVASPAQAAKVPEQEEPRWAHFEKVHVSLNVDEALTRKDKFADTHVNQERAVAPSALSPSTVGEGHQRRVPPEELQKQIQELSSTNQELRGRLDEQSGRMQQLQDQLEQLRHALPPQTPKQRSRDTRPAE